MFVGLLVVPVGVAAVLLVGYLCAHLVARKRKLGNVVLVLLVLAAGAGAGVAAALAQPAQTAELTAGMITFAAACGGLLVGAIAAAYVKLASAVV